MIEGESTANNTVTVVGAISAKGARYLIAIDNNNDKTITLRITLIISQIAHKLQQFAVRVDAALHQI